MPRVSVVIPTYNRAALLGRALKSVMDQTFQDYDVWVVDDGSDDGTHEFMEEMLQGSESGENRKRIHYLNTPNRGVAAARNLGIRHCGSEWIALLDSDDRWMPDKLERQLEFAEENRHFTLIHTDEIWIRNGARVNPPKSYRKYGGDVFLKCLPVCMIGPSTAMFTPDVFENAGGFDETYPVCEDYDFWLKTCSVIPAGYMNQPMTVKYGGHPDQLSNSRPALDYWRIKALCRILDIRDLVPDSETAVRREIVRKGKILLKGFLKHGRDREFTEIHNLISSAVADFRFEEDRQQ